MRPALAGLLLLCACAGAPPAAPPAEPVRTGLDRLVAEGFARLRGRRVGLVTNPTGVDRQGRRGVDLMLEHGVDLRALFSPEHGWLGLEDREGLEGVRDAATGLRVHSLYGETKKPTPDMLAGLDVLVVDVQDLGVRFYTYLATLGLCLEAAAEEGLQVLVLDRPNPLGGHQVAGPLPDPDLVGRFVSSAPVPIVHGLTLGEAARFLNRERGAPVEVLEVTGWRRGQRFDATGLPWVNPSPNLRSLEEALLYPGVALTEYSPQVSVGRGTDRPFEYVGAPWIDGERLARELRRREPPGVWVAPMTFVPGTHDVSGREHPAYPFVGEPCHGVRLVVSDRDALRPVEVGLALLAALRAHDPQRYALEPLRPLVGATWVLDALEAGEAPAEIARRWRAREDFRAYLAARASVLLYE